MAKPVKKPEWMNGVVSSQVVEPTAGEKAAGWSPDFRPPAEYLNWLLQNISDWCRYLDEQSSFVELNSSLYKAIVGSSAICTHASIAAALADASVIAGSRILVITDQTVSAQIQISKANISLEFANNISMTKSGSTSCFRVSANGVKIKGARISGFSTAGDKGIIIDSGIKNVMLRDIVFASCNIEVDDSGTNTSQLGNITEE